MSWELVRLPLYSGPEDPVDRLLLVAVAERQHHAADTAYLSMDDLAAVTQRSRSTTAERVRRLRADGWLLVVSGGGRGRANGYRLGVERFSTDPLNSPAHRTVSPPENSPAHRTVSAVNRPAGATKPSGPPDPTHNHEEPSSSSAAPALPVVAGVATADDDEVTEALNGIPGVMPTRLVRRLVGTQLGRGWTCSSLNQHLRQAMAGNPTNPMGCLTEHLRDMPPPPPERPTVPAPTGPPCRECALPESECRRREHTSGHTYAPLPRLIWEAETG